MKLPWQWHRKREPDPRTVACLAQAIEDIETLHHLQAEEHDAYRFLIDESSPPASVPETRSDELAPAAR
jgi:hypothetical protein